MASVRRAMPMPMNEIETYQFLEYAQNIFHSLFFNLCKCFQKDHPSCVEYFFLANHNFMVTRWFPLSARTTGDEDERNNAYIMP